MIKRFCYLVIIILVSCSSLPEKTYSKNTIKTVYSNYLAVADNARQQENYPLALTYYTKAIEFAASRNERKDVGIIRLKKAHVYLTTNNATGFESEVNQVKQMILFEKINLSDQLDFILAKSLYANKNTTEANEIIKKLISKYKDFFEKETYYTFQFQRYNSGFMSLNVQKEKISELVDLFEDGDLENIEVLSFCLFQYCRALKNKSSQSFEREIQKALHFYKIIENQKRIRNCYGLLADFHINDKNKSAHYLNLSK